MPRFTISVNNKVTDKDVENALLRKSEAIVSSCCDATTQASSLCKTLCYAALSIVPERDKQSKSVFTIEELCTYQKGLIKIPMHDTLLALGGVALRDTVDTNLLCVLSEGMLQEVFEAWNIKHLLNGVYAALAKCYLTLIDKNTENLSTQTPYHITSDMFMQKF